MLEHTTNPCGILVLNLSLVEGMKRHTKYSENHCPYDLADNKVNDIYIVYKIRKYDSSGTEHNYLFSCRMGDNHRGICFLKDEKTMIRCRC